MRAVTALPFGGKYRVIDFTLSNLCNSDLYHVGLLTQHAPLSLHAHVGIGKPWDLDHRNGGVTLLQPYQRQSATRWYLGTADAIRQNLDVLRNARARQVILLPGDLVYKMDYSWLLKHHVERSARVTLAVSPIDNAESHRFGICQLAEGGHIQSFLEKPPPHTPGLGFMGVAVFDTGYLETLLLENPDGHNLVMDIIIPLIQRGEQVDSYRFEGYWEDVGTLPAYYRASMDLLADTPRLNLYDPEWVIYTRSEELPPARLGGHSRIDRSLVASGCRVDGIVENSILFPGVRVETGAIVRDSIVMNGTRIGPGAVVDRAILDKWVHVGARAHLGHGEGDPTAAAPNADNPAIVRDGLMVVGREARIPEGCRIGRHTVIEPGVAPEDLERHAGVPASSKTASGPELAAATAAAEISIPAGETVHRRSEWVSGGSPELRLLSSDDAESEVHA